MFERMAKALEYQGIRDPAGVAPPLAIGFGH